MHCTTVILADHRGFADRSEDPRVPESVGLGASEANSGIVEPAIKSVNDQGIDLGVHGVLYLPDHPSQPRGRLPALKHRELYSFAIFLADLGNALESQ